MQQGRFLRRALLRGSLAASTAALSGRLLRRGPGPVVAGAAAGLVTGAVMEHPVTAVLAAPAAFAVRRTHRRDPVAGPALALAAGAGVVTAFGTRRFWPVAPRTAAQIRPLLTPRSGQARADGEGITFVVNASAGPALREGPADALRAGLPAAEVVELDEGADLVAALRTAAAGADVLGVAGGDGSINAAAAVAHGNRQSLVVVPAGTLNHFCRDLGIDGVDDAVAAVRDGYEAAVDLGSIDGKPFLNTASLGSYSDLVDARERLEARIGKWPAMLVALVGVLRRAEPLEVELDGTRRLLWMVFVGNCRYHPAGFAPAWRERLDDGQLDIRLVSAEEDWARTRLLVAVLTGRLGRCRVYEAYTASTLHVVTCGGPPRLARDGETFEGNREFVIRKEERPLAVLVPVGD